MIFSVNPAPHAGLFRLRVREHCHMCLMGLDKKILDQETHVSHGGCSVGN